MIITLNCYFRPVKIMLAHINFMDTKDTKLLFIKMNYNISIIKLKNFMAMDGKFHFKVPNKLKNRIEMLE